jgi:hypothetical protein
MRQSRVGRFERWAIALALCIVAFWGTPANAKQIPKPAGPPLPRIFSVFPAGARSGTTIEVTVSGLDLDEPEGLLFSAPGITATSIPLGNPAPEPAKTKNRRRGTPGLGPLLARKFRVIVPADAPVGVVDARLLNRWGVSNPRAFVVGDLSEVLEAEPNDDVSQAQRVEINTTVNGVVNNPTDVDDFVFAGRAGQRVLASALTSAIDSRAQLGLELHDAHGKKLASAHEYQGSDALLDHTLPSDGDYLLRVHAYTYSQGGSDSFYRMSLTTAPWIDAVFPSVIEPGKTAEVTVHGRNLPGGVPDPSAIVDGLPLERISARVTAPAEMGSWTFGGFAAPESSGLDGFGFRVKNNSGSSNPHLITLAKAAVVLDKGSNETPDTAQEVVPPCEIAGRIENRHDRDWYAFTAKKGDVLSIEAYAQRLGSPIDVYFALRNGRTKQMLGELDDEPPRPIRSLSDLEARNQFFTRTDDPARFRLIAPEDGRYELLVSSREAPGLWGPRHLYRVRITAEQPDFHLVVLPLSPTYPDSLVLRRGGESEATVVVWREDGFNDEITLTAEDLPAGVSCPPQVVGSNTRHGVLVLSASADASLAAAAIRVIGKASIAGRPVVREARGASITWPVPPQQNIPTISRINRSLVLAVRDQSPFRFVPALATITLAHGDKASIPFLFSSVSTDVEGAVGSPTAVDLQQPLANSVKLSPSKDGARVDLDINSNAPPGVYSLVFRAQAQASVVTDLKAKTKTKVTMTQPSAPVTLTILPKELARVTVSTNDLSVKPGATALATVRVARLHAYAGEFQLDFVETDDTRGLRAESVTIPAGQDSATLKIEADDDAKPGDRGRLIARATGLYRGTMPVSQETRFNVRVAK